MLGQSLTPANVDNDGSKHNKKKHLKATIETNIFNSLHPPMPASGMEQESSSTVDQSAPIITNLIALVLSSSSMLK